MEIGDCNRAGLCNFMHLKSPAHNVKREMFEAQRKSMKILKMDERAEGGSRSREDRSRSRSR